MPKNEMLETAEEGLTVKKLKTEPVVQGDTNLETFADENLRSDFEVQEIFSRVPVHILQEIFGCLDNFHAIQKFRCLLTSVHFLTKSSE